MAWRGKDWPGLARHGKAGFPVRRGKVGRGRAGQGLVYSTARQGFLKKLTKIKIGYRIAEPGTEIDIPDSKCKRATNQYVRAVKEMQYIDLDKIKDDVLKQRTVRIAQDRANLIGLLNLGKPRQIEA